MNDPLLLTVGPTMSYSYTLAQGSRPLPYFRTPAFSEVNNEICSLFNESIDAEPDGKVILLTCSGTGAMDAVVTNLFDKVDRLLIINGGGFGTRFVEIVSCYGIPHDVLNLEPGRALKANDLEAYESKEYSGLLVNMHETSTGLLYDMPLLSDFCKRKKMFFCVDAISSYMADFLSVRDWGIDALIVSSQKALALPPGISLVALSERARKKSKTIAPIGYYLNFAAYLTNIERGQTPFTPAVGIHIQLLQRLRALKELGFENEIERVALLARSFRQSIKALPLEVFPETPSNALTALMLKDGRDAQQVNRELIQRFDIYINPNGGDLGQELFRVGHIGAIEEKDLQRLLRALTILNNEEKI